MPQEIETLAKRAHAIILANKQALTAKTGTDSTELKEICAQLKEANAGFSLEPSVVALRKDCTSAIRILEADLDEANRTISSSDKRLSEIASKKSDLKLQYNANQTTLDSVKGKLSTAHDSATISERVSIGSSVFSWGRGGLFGCGILFFIIGFASGDAFGALFKGAIFGAIMGGILGIFLAIYRNTKYEEQHRTLDQLRDQFDTINTEMKHLSNEFDDLTSEAESLEKEKRRAQKRKETAKESLSNARSLIAFLL